MIREEDLVNEDLEGFRITAEVTQHASSSIFLGESISPGASYQKVVIELLYAARTLDKQKQEDILQKITPLQALRHPHILPILAFNIYKDVPYIISEYLPSGSLYDRFQRKLGGLSMPVKDAFLTLAQVGQALRYAHQRQVIHGSLTSQDVLFTLQDEALVTGFHRHALLLHDEADEARALERAIYRAPEQLVGETSEKSDQYALGCLAYALFTGSQAFMVPSANTPGAFYKTKTLIAPGRVNSALLPSIERAILKAMSRKPDQRYPTIDAFLAALGIPPEIENSDLKETVAILAQIMQGEFPKLPTTPATGIDTFDTVKTPVPSYTIATRDGVPTNSDTFSRVPPDILGAAQAVTFSDGTLLDEENQTPTELQQSSPINGKPSFRTIKKSFTSRPRRAFVVSICLIAIILICLTALVNLSFSTSSKRSATSPATQITAVVRPPIQPNIPGSTVPVLRTPSSIGGITVPSKTVTPQSTIAPTAAPTAAPAQVQIALSPFFNNEGMGNAAGQANFDGTGYSYPVSQLPSGGQITLQGVPYQFPAHGAGTNDNMVAFGQTISLTPGNYKRAYLLAASSWGPVTGTVTIRYTDGSISKKHLTVANWYTDNGVLNTTFRYTPNGIENHPVCIYAIPITLDSARVADALILPKQFSRQHRNGLIHIFALTLLR